MAFSRRYFLGRAAAVAGLGSLPAMSGSVNAAAVSSRGRPRRIIHLVSDGMSSGTLACSDQLSHQVRGRGLQWMDLYRHPEATAACVDMRSLNSLVTDSAAASSSWGCGSRVKNGSINTLPDGRPLRPLGPLFGEIGWARGLVTTTEITHATPAGFAANVASRDDAQTIALQYLERRIEVLLGGGRQYFAAKNRKDKRDLEEEYRAWGYRVMPDREALGAAPLGDRWLGLFASGHLPFTVDRDQSAKLQAEVPPLAEMTSRALERLERYGRFLLQVEGGRVDHGAHASDAAAAFFDQIAFDEALEVALEFQRRHGDTLVVVTTDHGNSNPGLNGMGSEYTQSPQLLGHLRRVQASFGEIRKRLVKAAGPGAEQQLKSADGKTTRDILVVDPGVIRSVLEEATGYEVPRGPAEGFARFLAGQTGPLYSQLASESAQLGQLMANYLGVGWTGTAHTSDYVPLVALGPGADRFHGFIKNTDIFRHYTDLVGIKHRNPEVPLLAECGPTAAEAERWVLT